MLLLSLVTMGGGEESIKDFRYGGYCILVFYFRVICMLSVRFEGIKFFGSYLRE